MTISVDVEAITAPDRRTITVATADLELVLQGFGDEGPGQDEDAAYERLWKQVHGG